MTIKRFECHGPTPEAAARREKFLNEQDAPKPRELHEVIDQMALVVPSLGPALEHVRRRAVFSAPETMWMVWDATADILSAQDPGFTEKQRAAVRQIFSGKPGS